MKFNVLNFSNTAHLFLLFMSFIFSPKVAAIPSEGLNEWGIKKQNSKFSTQLNANSNHSFWLPNYNSLEGIFGYKSDSHLYIMGYQASENLDEVQRDAWFIKYEYLLSNASISFKYIHNNWYWISSGKESLGLSFNLNTSWGGYSNFGYYHRWLKQAWNSSPYSPFNFNTNDKDGFFIFNLGWSFEYSGSILTVDFNNRDAFNYYSADNWALDSKYYMLINNDLAFTTTLSIRFTGLWGAAPYPGSGHLAVGLEF
jgi:hypothetical protein